MAGQGVERSDQHSFVVKQLCAEFGDRVDPVTIQDVAAGELAGFADARVREFVPIFAWRRARARIRRQLDPAAPASRGDLRATTATVGVSPPGG